MSGHRRRLVGAVVATAAVALTASACVRVEAPDAAPPSAQMTTPTPEGWARGDTDPVDSENSGTCEASGSLRPPAVMPAPNRMPRGSTMEAIHQRGVLIAGVDIGSNLFSFRDPATGEIEGFDIDVAREMARAIFGDPNRIEFRILSSSERISALETNSVDIVVKTMSITCDRLDDVAFSTVYFEASQRILTLQGSPITGVSDLAGRRVCVARGTSSARRIEELAPKAQIYTTGTWADCLVALQQNQTDAISTDDAILAGLAAQDPYARVVGSSLGVEPYGIGINKDHTDLVRFVNGVLAQMRADGRWYQLYDTWLSILGPAGYPPQPTYRD
ncbi:glutamate ABC transporter substrate-binding protein [Gordonia jinhuaensis]|uniref:ABC transporter substrate-binding protein n=1 Tax=Gordonia jinhuaensis TaxID=1517702 RepID=A0A916WZE6_9ACTN|nr:glutamate ABC transporter substrate-binding protein [Gordonia jinhuaensis]GGB41915.1 ABC transporter substrate-binding protein [Gordonia jinhuaensis]